MHDHPLHGLEIDARTDLYSLGMQLYQLPPGTQPFDRKLNDASLDRILQIIREEEPPKPSTRITMRGDGPSILTKTRHTD